MHIISRKRLREFWELHPDAEQPLRAWHSEVERSLWKTPIDITNLYSTASILKSGRVVFDIKGGNYRIVVAVRYVTETSQGTVFIRFVGTHSEYDRIDPETI